MLLLMLRRMLQTSLNGETKIKGAYKQREGENITFTPILIEAIVKAIKDFPMVNVSVSGNQIIKRKNINIGMATALPSGNLIVPVIKNADRLSLSGLTKSVNELANNARENKLKPEDIQTHVYTVGKENGYDKNLRDWFKLIYEVIFGEENGHRMGFFISFFGLNETIELINKKIK